MTSTVMKGQKVRAEIVCIGDELLYGQIVNTNAAWMGKTLTTAGFSVEYSTVIKDDVEAIQQALELGSQRSALVLVTGGLGPTKDDKTKAIVADFFESPLVQHEAAYQRLKAYFEGKGKKINELNAKQAEIPQKSIYFENRVGTAPGMGLEKGNAFFAFMPGVPFEMKVLMEEQIMPFLKERFVTPYILHKNVIIAGIGESHLAQKIEVWEDALPAHIGLAYLPSPGKLRLRLTALGDDKEQLEQELQYQFTMVEPLIADYIVAFEDEGIQNALAELLIKKQWTIATAESCTAGNIAHQLTTVAGSSAYFIGATVAYSNKVKQQELGVDSSILQQEGAVSEACVLAMAKAVKAKMNTDISVAVSGIAGPGGGTVDKPVGTVWVAWAWPDGSVSSELLQLNGPRAVVVERTTAHVLYTLWKELRTLKV